MKRWILPLAIALGMMTTFIVLPATGFAGLTAEQIEKQLADIKRQKEAAQKSAAAAKNQLSKVQSDIKVASRDIQSILKQIDDTNLKLNDLNDQVDKVTAELMENVRQLEMAEERIAARDNMLRSRLRLMYTNGVVSYADVLLSSTSFGDFLDRLHALQSIVNQDKEILESNKKDRDLIEEKKQEVELQLATVQDLYDQTAAIKEDLLVREKEKEVTIASLSKQEKDLGDISEEQSRQVTKIAALESELQRQLNAITFTYTGGKLQYPLPKLYTLTSAFGTRTDPITGKKGAFHQGLDFGAPGGTSILAAEQGVVLVAAWMSGYGNTVIIDHGKDEKGRDIWTLYGHIRNNGIVVKKGAEVKRGQKIAEVGTTGKSTGNHLHFEVRINGEYVDPKSYLNLK